MAPISQFSMFYVLWMISDLERSPLSPREQMIDFVEINFALFWSVFVADIR